MNQFISFLRTNETLYSAARWARDRALYAKGLHRGAFSQHGEDVWLRKHLPDGSFYIDVGASHPFLLSNTYMLYRQGWRGITVEPLPGLAELHRRWRPEDTLIQKAVGPIGGRRMLYELFPSVLSTLDEDVADRAVADGTAEIVGNYHIDVITLDTLLDRHAPQHVDLLSIDLEGLDADVICSCVFATVKPRVIIVEFNDAVSRTRTLGHLVGCGYHWAAELGCNLIMEDLG
jgi:FkbM family methyltransferase